MLIDKLSLKHLIRKPSEETGVSKPPLFLLMHGYGSNEENVLSLSSEIPANFFTISLRAPYALPFGGFSWCDIDFSKKEKEINMEQASKSVQSILQFINEATINYHLDETNVWLCGFSQGAIVSYILALNYPEKIKKVIALSGFLKRELLEGEIKIHEKNHDHLNFFISHGVHDSIIPIEWAREGEKLLSTYKLRHFYKEYDCSHEVTSQTYKDMLDWIKKHLELI